METGRLKDILVWKEDAAGEPMVPTGEPKAFNGMVALNMWTCSISDKERYK